eukprot:7515784-Alexandrium_andersonii.AAC.1
MPSPEEDLCAWELFAGNCPGRWRARVRDVLSLSPCSAVCPVVGAREADGDVPEDAVCFECGQMFKTRARLLQHAAAMHQYRHPANWYADSSGTCRCCMRAFWTRQRLMRHLTVDA